LLDDGHFDALLDHSYTQKNSLINDSIDMSALTYFIGYIARQAKKFSTAKHCESCYSSLINDVDINVQDLDPEDNIIKSRSKGFLLIPSNSCCINGIKLLYRPPTNTSPASKLKISATLLSNFTIQSSLLSP